MKYIVYLTTNKKSQVNSMNRIYIGVHKTTNPEVFDGYIGCGVNIHQPSTYMYPKTSFQYAVKKYGCDAFIRDILYVFDTPEQAYNKEMEIVNEDFIKQSHVYNTALGGHGGNVVDPRVHSKPIYQFDLQGNLIKEWESTLDVSDFYGYSCDKFTMACVDKVEFIGFFWSRENRVDGHKIGKKQFTYLYDINGKLVSEFISRTKCAEYLNCCPQSVSNALRNSKIIKNHYVSDKIVDLYIPKARKNLENESIYVYNTLNEFIGCYYGKEVFKVIDLHSYSKLNKAFNDNNGWYKDFYLSLTPVEKVPNKLTTKRIDVYSLTGELIETLSSLKEIKEKYDINSAELNRILKGIKNHKQYIFRYSK